MLGARSKHDILKIDMKLQLWRNATLQLTIHDYSLLIDPMLGKKGSLGVFPWTEDQRTNPLVDLPFSEKQLREKLASIDAVFVSHLHPDHWDEAAAQQINNTIPIICPEAIAGAMASYGFRDVQALTAPLAINQGTLHLTDGQHGTGEIGEKMGQVHGLVVTHQEESVYVAGDTIWCEEVKDAIDSHQPKHIIVAGGAATFAIGKPVTMTAQDIKEMAAYHPDSTIWITHLETISPCKEDRTFLTDFLAANHLQDRCKLLNDGEEADLL